MDFDTSISSSWSLKSNWDDPIFGSAVKRNELASLATPISKDLTNENSNQTTETPPTISDNNKKSINEVSIGEKENLAKFSESNLQPNIKGSLVETPKRIIRTHENIQTPKEQRNERYPSPLPSNKTFSLNLASTPINSKNSITPTTPVTPKTPKNSYNFQSPGLFSTPRVISGRITSPCSHKTLEELQKILDPDIINMVKKSKEEIKDEKIDNKNDTVNENSNFHFEISSTKNDEQDRDENLINEDLPIFGENDTNLDENQEELNLENFNQEELHQEEPNQEESNQEELNQDESNQNEINFGQYFRHDSTPSKIYRTSRLQSILNQRKEDDQMYDQFQVKQILLDLEQENTEDQKTIISESNNSYDSNKKQNYEHENNDSLPFQQSQPQNSESDIKDSEINDENKKKEPSQIFLSQINKFFAPISRSTPKRKLETDQTDNNNNSEEQTQKQSSFTYTVLSKSENKDNRNSPIQQSDKTFVPETPQKSFETHSNDDSLNLNDQQSSHESEIKENLLNDQNGQSKSFQYQVIQTGKRAVPEIPTFQPDPIINDTKAKEEDQTESSDTESHQSPDDNSNHPIEKRIFMKYLSKRSNENSPRINVKGERNEADYLSKLMKEEENKAAISPSKKVKTIQILPNHQLSCTANKKSARYIVEEGELSMVIESKKYNIGKGGVFDIIKGKEIILINNGKEPAVIAKINRT